MLEIRPGMDPLITKLVTEPEIRTTFTRMVIAGNQARNGPLDYRTGN